VIITQLKSSTIAVDTAAFVAGSVDVVVFKFGISVSGAVVLHIVYLLEIISALYIIYRSIICKDKITYSHIS
jgi:hypothetical protein